MLKGVVIFGAGVTVGYMAAMRNQEPNAEIKSATVEFVNSLKAIANDAWLDAKNEAKDAKEKVEEAAKSPEDPIVDPVEPPPIPRDPSDPAA